MQKNFRTRADTDLLACTRGGDLAAFGEIVNRYQQMVCAVAFATCGRRALSEDVAQETFVAAWKNIDKLQDDEKLKAWLCSIARHRAKDALRKRRREVLTEDGTSQSEEFSTTQDDAPSPMESTANLEEEQQLWQALEAIPSSYREPLVLFYRDGQSIQNVADDLGLSVAAVKQRLSRGRAALRDSLANVSSCLARSQPSKAFTVLVMAAVSAHAGLAGAASIAQAAPSGGFPSGGLPAGAVAKPGALAGAASVMALFVAFLCSATLLWILLGLSSSAAPKHPQPAALLSASAQVQSKSGPSVDTRGPADANAKMQVNLGGRVLDLFGRSVAGATVVLNSTPTRTALSDERGDFAFVGVEVGSYVMQARNRDGGSRPYAMHLHENHDDLVLKIVEGSAIELQLIHASGGDVLPGIEVTLESGALELSATTDARGVAIFEGISSSTCTVRVEAPGFATSELMVFLGAEAAVHKRRLAMHPGLALEGIVVDDAGKAIAGAKIRLEGAPTSPRRDTTISDEQGHWHFDTVASDEGLLVATHDDYAWITMPIGPGSDGTLANQVLVMPRGKSASGLVVHADGSPAPFAEVMSHPSGKSTSADARGYFHLAGLEPGESHLRATHQVFGSSAQALGNDGKNSNDLVLVLEDHSLRGVVLDSRGKPIAGATVRAMRQEREIIEEGGMMQTADDQSNQRGEFTLGPLPGDAGFDVVAIMPGVSPAYLHLAPLKPVEAHSGDSDIELRLAPAGQVVGRVSSPQGSVEEFAVTIANYAEALDMEASSPFSGTEGSFALNEVPAGVYSIGIVAAGFEPKVLEDVRIKAGATLDLGSLNLRAGTRARGRVLNADGLPVKDARVLSGDSMAADATHLVRLYEKVDDGADPFAVSNSSSLEVRTDAEGYFELANLHHNRGSLYVAAESDVWGRSQVTKLAKRQSGELVLRLQPGAGIVGTIENAGKECLVSAVPLLANKRTSQAPLLIQSEQSGSRFRLGGLAPGSYLLSAHGMDAEPDFENAIRVDLKAGESARVELSMSTRQAPLWSDATLESYELHVDTFCACTTESCRAQERDSLDEIDKSHGVMTSLAYSRVMQLDDRLESCDR